MAARRLGQVEAYLTVRQVLSEASTASDGVLSRERSDFYRFGCGMLGLHPSTVHYCCSRDDLIHSRAERPRFEQPQMDGSRLKAQGTRQK